MRILISSILCQSGLMTHVLDLVDYLVNHGVEVVLAYQRVGYLDMDARRSILSKHGDVPYFIFDEVEQLEAYVRNNKIQIIHAHSHATFQAVTEVSQKLDIPLVVTLHSVFPWKRYFTSPLNTASKIIAVGPAQAYSAREFMDKIEIIQNGINTRLFVPGESHQNPSKQINILWYGRVDGRLARGLRALDRVVPLLPKHIKVTGLGTSDFNPRNIEMIPWVDEPLHYLQKSQITFAHSRSLREAMACGSIGMLLGYGYGGVVTEQRLREEGLILDAFPEYRLVRPRSQLLLRDILLLANNANLEGLRKDARLIAERYFTLEDMGRNITRIYQELIRKPV